MSAPAVASALAAVERRGRGRTALLDILRDIQNEQQHVPPEAVTAVAAALGIPRVEVQGVASFYAFLGQRPQGRVTIRVCDDIADRLKGFRRVLDAFQQALGVPVGGTTSDGAFTLTTTPCIGLSDQAPAALIGDVPVTELGTDRVWSMVRELRGHETPTKLVRVLGDGNNADPLIHAMVKNNIQVAGPVVLSPIRPGEALRKAVAVSPQEVIRAVKAARLRGRGGAGFPTGMKWEFARGAPGSRKFVVCNADEGEPGTFKDRVLLTERPDRVFAGMTIAGYAIGAAEGILYLRGEYAYLRRWLEATLERRRAEGLLGARIGAQPGFSFDIRIQMGAGAYVCGEESALLNSCEGLRGDPRNRPPFPAQRGYLGCPTVVNNVETLCCVVKILEEGPASFAQYGTPQSAGTKLFSVSGECWSPGVFELDWGITLGQLLERAGAGDAVAAQVGGPSGRLVPAADFKRKLCFDDLATGGAVLALGPDSDLLEMVRSYQAFFAEESCGYCTPCRAGNQALVTYLDRLRAGKADAQDLDEMIRIAATMKATSRCGLGQTACNPFLTSLQAFPDLYEVPARIGTTHASRPFDLAAATATHRGLRDRHPEVEDLPDWAE